MKKIFKNIELDSISQNLLNSSHFIFNFSYVDQDDSEKTRKYESFDISGGFRVEKIAMLMNKEADTVYCSHGMTDIDISLSKEGLLTFYVSPSPGLYNVYVFDKDSTKMFSAAIKKLEK